MIAEARQSVWKSVLCLQNELRRLEGIEHAEHELNMLQQAHAIATAQQVMARLAAADQREAIAQHEHRLQQMHDAQASTNAKQQWLIAQSDLFNSCVEVWYVLSFICHDFSRYILPMQTPQACRS